MAVAEAVEIPNHIISYILYLAKLPIDIRIALKIKPKKLIVDDGFKEKMFERYAIINKCILSNDLYTFSRLENLYLTFKSFKTEKGFIRISIQNNYHETLFCIETLRKVFDAPFSYVIFNSVYANINTGIEKHKYLNNLSLV